MENSALDRLASQLANNHTHLAFPSGLWRMANDQILKVSGPVTSRAVVVVTGSGASAADAKLPLASETGEILKGRLRIPEQFLRNELDRLTTQYRLGPEEFETQLLAFSKFGGSELVSELKSIFYRRYYSSQTYEILSHLLKHRFVDAIVNFNFDELLDQAIEDEVTQGSYTKVITDGDLSGDIKNIFNGDLRLKAPLYIKPHGTASHGSSLRFTREAYFLLPPSIKELLSSVLANTPTTLLVIGFAMNSVEFNQIVELAANNDFEIYIIDPVKSVVENIPKSVENINHISPDVHGLGGLVSHLWDLTRAKFKDTKVPRGILRHQLISKLFSEKVDYLNPEKSRVQLRQYLRDRTIIEIAMTIAKTKGFVNIEQLASNRAGRYFRYYRDHSIGGNSDTLLNLCERLGLSKFGYSYDALRLSRDPSYTASPLSGLIIDRESWKKEYKNRLVKAVLACLSPNRGSEASKAENKKLLHQALDYMYSLDEVEVVSPKEIPFQMRFHAPTILGSLAATKVFTTKILNMEWSTLLCIAESGEWLLDDEIVSIVKKKRNRHLKVVVADEVFVEKVKEKYNDIDKGISIEVIRLPWWLHNQHMTIILNKNIPQKGIYFERRLRTLSITPVGLRESNDLNMAMTTFFAYWCKAERYEKKPESIFITTSDIDNAKARLLNHC